MIPYVVPIVPLEPVVAPVQLKKLKYVKVIVPRLNVRKLPSWEPEAVAGEVRAREVFTVVDTLKVGNTPMHKLKSGLYITGSSKYVETYEK